jgi:hypothetical protein
MPTEMSDDSLDRELAQYSKHSSAITVGKLIGPSR